jgi:signal transduction histidine kinase
MRTKFRSMRARMTALFAFFVALLMLAGGSAVQHREERRAEKRTREILEVAKERASVELDEVESFNKSLLQVVQTDAYEIAAGGLILVVSDSQQVLWRSRKHSPNWPSVGQNWRIQTLSSGGQTLILALDWEPIEEDLEETARALWLLGAIIVGATTVAAWFVVGKTLLPLNRLAAQAKNASIDGLQVRLQSPSSDAEMQHLTQTLNALLQRLEKEAQARGRFYAAASHELRTPLQALLGQIDVALSRQRSVVSHEAILVQLQEETERLAALVQDLLQLNALEMRQKQAPLEKLNLAFWLQRALDQQAGAIAERDLTLVTHLCEAQIEVPTAHIEMLLRNLLENAAKYATPKSELRVQIADDTRGIRLQIWNDAALPENAQIENWFEPFFRPDASRNSQTGGNGLGLSIVAALARINGWKVDIKAQDGGVLASVDFPRA